MTDNSNSLFGKPNEPGKGSLFGSTPAKLTFGATGNTPNAGSSSFAFKNDNAFTPSKPAAGSSTGGFNFNLNTNTNSQAFSFGGDKKSSTAPTFGNGPTAATTESKPAFAFGNTASSSSVFGSNAAQTSDNASKPAFTFGGASGDKKQDAPKPSFSFSAKTDSKPTTFAFGGAAKANEKNDESKPTAFAFGNASTSNEKKDESKPTAFAFGGAQSNEKKDEAKPTAFAFGGATKANEKKDETKPTAFAFGGAAKANEKKDESKPTGFAFGGAAKPNEQKEESKSFSFGAKQDDKKSATGAPSFSFGNSSGTTLKAEETKPAFSFGATSTNDKPAQDKNETSKPGFSSGNPEQKDQQKCDSTKPAFSFGAKQANAGKDSTENPAEKKTVSFSNSVIARDEKKDSSKVAEPRPVSLSNKTLEDLITKWTNQLSKASSTFQTYSSKVRDWDRVLVDGGEKISQLYNDTVVAEQTQSKIDQALLYIERQQDELENFLDNYEAKAETLLADVLSSTNQTKDQSVITNDHKREQGYHTAELLDENLNSLAINLSSLIKEINEVSDSFNKTNGLGQGKEYNNNEEADNSSNQIVKLLNTHLDSLTSIQKNAEELKEKVESYKD